MRRLSITLVVAGMAMLFVRAGAEAAEDERQRLVAPVVLSQADFALQLARALALPLEDDANADEAMRALGEAGIEPPDGWAPETPVTPDVVAEWRRAVTNAAAAGRLQVEPAAALAAFTQLVTDLGLPLPYEPPAYAGGQPVDPRYCDRAALDDYYGAAGPPYYTYCPPPPSYYYMYSWVPSRFYWGGYFFSGFFVLRDVHVVPRFKHRPRPPRFSDGVLGGHRKAIPSRPPPGAGKRFGDVAPGRHGPVRTPPRERVHVAPRAPERPRFSDGVLGGRRGPPAVTRPGPPLGASRPAPSWRSSPPANARPGAARSPVPGAARPPASVQGRGWRDALTGRR